MSTHPPAPRRKAPPASAQSQRSPGEPRREQRDDRGLINGSATVSDRDVFVIHGRDMELRTEVFDLLRAVDLRPLEWELLVAATGSTAPSLLTVVQTALRRARATVALLTPDDIVRLHPDLHKAQELTVEAEPRMQARPNVLLELGMALMAHPTRTIILEIGELRPITDIGGLNTIQFDGSEVAVGQLIQRLKMAGCRVDDTGGDWRNARRFGRLKTYARRPI